MRRRDSITVMQTTVVAIACARNEADIIEAFVRHTLEFADRLIVVDHESIDATSRILESLAAEGLPVEVRSLSGMAWAQAETFNAMIEEVTSAVRPDWIVPLDVDEFLVSKTGGARKAIETLPTDRPSTATMKMFVPAIDDDAHEPNVLKRMCHRIACDTFPDIKVIAIPRALHAGGRLSPGNHAYTHPTAGGSHPATNISTAHFPIRCPLQLQAKALGWINNIARANYRNGESWHWEKMFRAFCEGTLDTPARATAWAMAYARNVIPDCDLRLVHDPVTTVPLRYAHLAVRLNPRVILEELAERLGARWDAAMSNEQLAAIVEERVLRRPACVGTGNPY